MPKATADLRPATTADEPSRAQAFLREHWVAIVVSAIIGNLATEPFIPGDWGVRGSLAKAVLWLVPAAAVLFSNLAFWWLFERVMENNYKSLLIGRYLRRRRIAWVSLMAVMLCTTMVLVVISVMGGWLKMFKTSFRGLSGDVVVHTESLRGFRYYDQIIDALKKDPQSKVKAALPSIETYGLFNYGKGPVAVRVMGMVLPEMGNVNKFPESLYRQHTAIEERLKDPKLPAEERAKLEHLLTQPPSFDLLDLLSSPMSSLPGDVKLATAREGAVPGEIILPDSAPAELVGRLQFDALRHNLKFRGYIKQEWLAPLMALSADPAWKKAIDTLFAQSTTADLIPYHELAQGKANPLIVGTMVVGIRRNREGVWERPGPIEYEQPTSLTVLDLSSGNAGAAGKVSKTYFIIDDSHLGVWQYDSNYVYVPFETLQKDLGMDAQEGMIDDKPVKIPARVTDIHIKVADGIDPNDESKLTIVRDRIQAIIHQVMIREQQAAGDTSLFVADEPRVKTWQDTQRIWISAVENEKLMMVVLFAIISIVSVFLIFCIFYMIVVEKTKDIGIIKSVGATSAGIGGIFLGYGLTIGIVGSGLGALLSFLIVHNINELHTWLGRVTGMLIWNPEVYLFDKIPNEMSGWDVAIILPIAVLSSVLGALLPAIWAAKMNPVEALRWE